MFLQSKSPFPIPHPFSILHNLDNLLSPSVITMHIPTPEELRTRREALGLKQTELAKRAGISQSMVARIEAGNVDPRVSTLNKIIVVLNSAEPKKLRAAQIMHTPVLSVQPQDAITRAVDIFEKNNISQLPVIERGIPVGCISEAVIVKAIEQQRLHKTHLFTVRDFMESGFPTVPPGYGRGDGHQHPPAEPRGPGRGRKDGAGGHHQARPDIADPLGSFFFRERYPGVKSLFLRLLNCKSSRFFSHALG